MPRALRVTVLLLCGGGAAAHRHELQPEGTVRGHLIVRFRAAPPAAHADAVVERRLDPKTQLLHVRDDTPGGLRALRQRFARQPGVEWVEPEHYYHRTAMEPDDMRYRSGEQWSLRHVKMPAAWGRATGASDLVVAVLDTGSLPHPDLDPKRILPGYDFIASPDNAGDGDTWDADPTDVGTTSPASSGLHGMHVTGIIAAWTNNSVGIAGVDWKASVLPVRVLGVQPDMNGQGGNGVESDIAMAIRWAIGEEVNGRINPYPAEVINMSFGIRSTNCNDPHDLLASGVKAALEKNVVVIAAAGNEGTDTACFVPARLDGVIAVGATDMDDLRTSYSNTGSRLDLLAPGGDGSGPGRGILSTLDGDYDSYYGTSQATPHVTGVVNLMRGIDPTLSPDQIRTILTTSATLCTNCEGKGLLNADAALQAVEIGCRFGYHTCVRLRPTTLWGGCSLGAPRRTPGHWLFAMPAVLFVIHRARRRRLTGRDPFAISGACQRSRS